MSSTSAAGVVELVRLRRDDSVPVELIDSKATVVDGDGMDDVGFVEVLTSELPVAESSFGGGGFGRLVGSWDLQAEFFDEVDGSLLERMSGEWHFAWILGQRAIQDVLVFPSLSDGDTWSGRAGTTVRLWDGQSECWRVVWCSPADGVLFRLAGRWESDRFLLRSDGDGQPTRWEFTEVTDNSFLWQVLVSDDERDWALIQRMHAVRRGTS